MEGIRISPWREARRAAGLTLVDVSAEAKVSMNTSANYDKFGPDAVSEECARRLNAVYAPLMPSGATHANR